MQKTAIPWADYSINPVKGLCPMDCKDLAGKPYCYARKLYRRFKWDTELKFDSRWYAPLLGLTKAKRIFVGSTMELFGDWIPDEWQGSIIKEASLFDGLEYPQHTFIFLTKCPQNLPIEFPPNVWVGVSATNEMMAAAGIAWLSKISATIKFLSIEPLLSWDSENAHNSIIRWHPEYINWLILGSQTQPIRHPPREWVDEIISAADKAGIPVFVKEPMDSHFGIDRREYPAPIGGVDERRL